MSRGAKETAAAEMGDHPGAGAPTLAAAPLPGRLGRRTGGSAAPGGTLWGAVTTAVADGSLRAVRTGRRRARRRGARMEGMMLSRSADPAPVLWAPVTDGGETIEAAAGATVREGGTLSRESPGRGSDGMWNGEEPQKPSATAVETSQKIETGSDLPMRPTMEMQGKDWIHDEVGNVMVEPRTGRQGTESYRKDPNETDPNETDSNENEQAALVSIDGGQTIEAAAGMTVGNGGTLPKEPAERWSDEARDGEESQELSAAAVETSKKIEMENDPPIRPTRETQGKEQIHVEGDHVMVDPQTGRHGKESDYKDPDETALVETENGAKTTSAPPPPPRHCDRKISGVDGGADRDVVSAISVVARTRNLKGRAPSWDCNAHGTEGDDRDGIRREPQEIMAFLRKSFPGSTITTHAKAEALVTAPGEARTMDMSPPLDEGPRRLDGGSDNSVPENPSERTGQTKQSGRTEQTASVGSLREPSPGQHGSASSSNAPSRMQERMARNMHERRARAGVAALGRGGIGSGAEDSRKRLPEAAASVSSGEGEEESLGRASVHGAGQDVVTASSAVARTKKSEGRAPSWNQNIHGAEGDDIAFHRISLLDSTTDTHAKTEEMVAAPGEARTVDTSLPLDEGPRRIDGGSDSSVPEDTSERTGQTKQSGRTEQTASVGSVREPSPGRQCGAGLPKASSRMQERMARRMRERRARAGVAALGQDGSGGAVEDSRKGSPAAAAALSSGEDEEEETLNRAPGRTRQSLVQGGKETARGRSVTTPDDRLLAKLAGEASGDARGGAAALAAPPTAPKKSIQTPSDRLVAKLATNAGGSRCPTFESVQTEQNQMRKKLAQSGHGPRPAAPLTPDDRLRDKLTHSESLQKGGPEHVEEGEDGTHEKVARGGPGVRAPTRTPDDRLREKLSQSRPSQQDGVGLVETPVLSATLMDPGECDENLERLHSSFADDVPLDNDRRANRDSEPTASNSGTCRSGRLFVGILTFTALCLGVGLGLLLNGGPGSQAEIRVELGVGQNESSGSQTGYSETPCEYPEPWTPVGSEISDSDFYGNIDVNYFEWTDTVGGGFSEWTRASVSRAFGSAVSISGDGNRVAVAGRFGDSFAVYESQNNSWAQIGEDIVSEDTVSLDSFEEASIVISSIVLSGNGKRVAVGFPYHSDNIFSEKRGDVKVYEFEGGYWNQLGDAIVGPRNRRYYGSKAMLATSRDGNIVAIGDFHHGNKKGLVDVYQFVSGNWVQLGDHIYGENIGDQFGSVSLSANGMVLVAGAWLYGKGSGQVRVFRYEEGSWTQVGGNIYGGAGYCFFGRPVSISANASRVAVTSSARLNRQTDFLRVPSYKRRVRVFEYAGGVWTEMKTRFIGETMDNGFGLAISLSGDGSTLAIGSPNSNSQGIDQGHSLVYHYECGNWSQVGKDLNGKYPRDWSGFSISLSFSGERLAVGAPTDFGVPSPGGSGSVRVYSHEFGP